MSPIAFLDAADIRSALSVSAAADALEAALRSAGDGAADPPRSALRAPAGEMLVMPSVATGIPAVKIVTIRERGPGPRIQGVHVDVDPDTMAVRAVLDAAALTIIRTTAVSVLGLRYLAAADASRLAIIGAGPQALEHADAIAREWPIGSATIIARRESAAGDVVEAIARHHPGIHLEATSSDTSRARGALAGADIVVCATTATHPVVIDDGLGRDVAVVAIGSHQPDRRELPGELLARAIVVVEDRDTALREAGDVIQAIAEGCLTAGDIDADLGQLIRGEVHVPRVGARVFKSVGMAWEDAVVGAAVSVADGGGRDTGRGSEE